MDVYVNAEGFEDAPAPLIEAAVLLTLRAADDENRPAEISVTLLDDDDIRALNDRYVGHDWPTDVIAFSLGDREALGDVYVGLERARAQAAENGITLDEELVRLAVHGTLHVLGHDHPEGPERLESPMFELQERLVREALEGREP